jgi:hypothetical protein
MKSKKLVGKKLKEKTVKKGVLEFDLTDCYEIQSFKNAIDADIMKWKIDTIYDEVFRKHLKHEVPVIEGKKLTKSDMEILRILLDKITEHFKGE